MEVGLSPGDIVLDVDPAPPRRGTVPVWLNTAKDHKGPQRTITNPAKDHKGPQGSKTKDYKGLLGTGRICKELHSGCHFGKCYTDLSRHYSYEWNRYL